MPNIINKIDQLLNSITMYRLIANSLGLMAGLGILLSWLKILPFNPLQMLVGLIILSIFGVSSKLIFEKIFKSITNFESTLITVLILFLIFPAPENIYDMLGLAAAAVIANASKYLLAINRKHIFNPAAAAAVLTVYIFQFGATWWVGSAVLLPFTLILGLLIVRKIRRVKMFLVFIVASIITILFFGILAGSDPVILLLETITSWPLIFFGTIMLTEPLTTPLTTALRWQYAILVGFLFGSTLRIGFLTITPEVALVLGNLFSFFLSNRKKAFLTLKEKIKIAPEIYEFIFDSNVKLGFFPGQYFEITAKQSFKQPMPDSRGNRRFFTIASSPTENQLRLGIKVPENSSSFKKQLINSPIDSVFTADHLGGEFILPENPQRKLVFIAGGIGVTPFRSMIKYLIDKNEKRDIVVFFVGSSTEDFVYQEIFAEAEQKLQLKIHYVITQPQNVPKNWSGQVGYITAEMIEKLVPDFENRYFYLSGPRGMVVAYEKVLSELKIEKQNIITDYFPGF